MVYEKSCGALVVRQEEQGNRMYILMIRHRPGGYRSFPKGHVEAGETERQTAVREVREETARMIFLAHFQGDGPKREKVAKETGTTAATKTQVKKQPVRNAASKVGPNDPCPCGSGKKYKKCCMQKDKVAE